MSVVNIKRIYAPAEPSDGTRILVDRLWPRGLTKAQAAIDLWLKDIAPSAELRQWFGHDPARWQQFQARYGLELDGNTAAVERLVDELAKGKATLLFGAHDEAHNNAAALAAYLAGRQKGSLT